MIFCPKFLLRILYHFNLSSLKVLMTGLRSEGHFRKPWKVSFSWLEESMRVLEENKLDSPLSLMLARNYGYYSHAFVLFFIENVESFTLNKNTRWKCVLCSLSPCLNPTELFNSSIVRIYVACQRYKVESLVQGRAFFGPRFCLQDSCTSQGTW